MNKEQEEKIKAIVKEAKDKGKTDVATIAEHMLEDRTACFEFLAKKLAEGKIIQKLPIKIKITGHYDKIKDEIVLQVPIKRFLASSWIKIIQKDISNWLGLLFVIHAEWQEGNLKSVVITLKPVV